MQFMLEAAIAHLVRPQCGEWKVLFAGNAFDRYTLEEVLDLNTVTVGADISTVAGATNEPVMKPKQENRRLDKTLAFGALKETCLQGALPPTGRTSEVLERALLPVVQEFATRKVFLAVAFELHVSDNVVQQIVGGVNNSSQTTVTADTVTTIEITVGALGARVRSVIVIIRPEGSAATHAVQ